MKTHPALTHDFCTLQSREAKKQETNDSCYLPGVCCKDGRVEFRTAQQKRAAPAMPALASKGFWLFLFHQGDKWSLNTCN